MTLEQLGEFDVIHCSTEEQANILCKMMHEAGLCWSSGEEYVDNKWYMYYSRMCYRPFTGTFGNKKFYEEDEDNFNIIEFEDFFKQTSCKFMKRMTK